MNHPDACEIKSGGYRALSTFTHHQDSWLHKNARSCRRQPLPGASNCYLGVPHSTRPISKGETRSGWLGMTRTVKPCNPLAVKVTLPTKE